MKKLEYFPLSHPQKRIWLIEKVNPSQPMHNIGGVVRIAGNVDFPSLEYSINEFIKNNSGIRHRFTETNNDVKQYICEYRWLNIALYEFNNEEGCKHGFEKKQRLLLISMKRICTDLNFLN